MTRKQRARAILYYTDWQRRFHTHKAVMRGDMAMCYARMYARKPGVLYTDRWHPLVLRVAQEPAA